MGVHASGNCTRPSNELTDLANLAYLGDMRMKSASRPKLSPRREKTQQVSARLGSREVKSVVSYPASKAKNVFGRLLEQATRGEPVAITKHGSQKAYLISAAQYHALRHEPEQKLSILRQEFDQMFARMQTKKFRRGMSAAFHASPEKLGKAAVAAARKRG